MPSFQDLKRAWLLRSLGLSSGGSVNDLEAALYAANAGAASNRKMRPNMLYRGNTFAGSSGTSAPVLGTVFYAPFEVGFTTTFQSMHFEVTIAGSGGNVLTVGIYNDVNGSPSAKLVEGSVASVLGELSVPVNLTLQPGLYWLALVSLGGVTSTIRTYAAHTSPHIGSIGWPGSSNYSHYDLAGQAGLVNPFPGGLGPGGSTLCPIIMLKTAA